MDKQEKISLEDTLSMIAQKHEQSKHQHEKRTEEEVRAGFASVGGAPEEEIQAAIENLKRHGLLVEDNTREPEKEPKHGLSNFVQKIKGAFHHH